MVIHTFKLTDKKILKKAYLELQKWYQQSISKEKHQTMTYPTLSPGQ